MRLPRRCTVAQLGVHAEVRHREQPRSLPGQLPMAASREGIPRLSPELQQEIRCATPMPWFCRSIRFLRQRLDGARLWRRRKRKSAEHANVRRCRAARHRRERPSLQESSMDQCRGAADDLRSETCPQGRSRHPILVAFRLACEGSASIKSKFAAPPAASTSSSHSVARSIGTWPSKSSATRQCATQVGAARGSCACPARRAKGSRRFPVFRRQSTKRFKRYRATVRPFQSVRSSSNGRSRVTFDTSPVDAMNRAVSIAYR